mmetsp:Transcript_14684/g.24978  ORF Transcript_14684/g.24978 Transcript_14684/m.24978 type:complete len:85 (+) Transcript_14684:5686-5940(+)
MMDFGRLAKGEKDDSTFPMVCPIFRLQLGKRRAMRRISPAGKNSEDRLRGISIQNNFCEKLVFIEAVGRLIYTCTNQSIKFYYL